MGHHRKIMKWCILLLFSLLEAQEIMFPLEIPLYSVRKDHISNQHVSRGRFQYLRDIPKLEDLSSGDREKHSWEHAKKILQCSASEPEFRNALDLMNLITPEKETVRLLSAWAETKCYPWPACQNMVKSMFDAGNASPKLEGFAGSPYSARLVRIIKGKVYIDWPWKRSRFDISSKLPFAHLLLLVSLFSGFEDSVFFVGSEQPFMPWNFPFPAFSQSASFEMMDMAWPWIDSLNDELSSYAHALEKDGNFDFDVYRQPHADPYRPWSERLPKAFYLGELSSIRQPFFMKALEHPDLIDASWTCRDCGEVFPFHPNSTEPLITLDSMPLHGSTFVGSNGQLEASRAQSARHINPGDYKYAVVLTAGHGEKLAPELATLLAYSGAVVLLQKSDLRHYFSSRLLPWVHYVPLSYNALDVAEKIEWLRVHDDMAQKIAENAKNFGLSYLRLEDQFCYVGKALEMLGSLMRGSDVLQTFDAAEV